MTTIMTMKDKKNVSYANQAEWMSALGFDENTATKDELLRDLTREIKMRFSGDVDKNVNRTINQFKKLWKDDGIHASYYITKYNLGLNYMAIAATLEVLVEKF